MSFVNVETLREKGCRLWWYGDTALATVPKSVAAVGNASQKLPFLGVGACLLDGNDWLSLADSTDWNVFEADFTIEVLCYLSNLTTERPIISQGTVNTDEWSLCITTGNKIYLLCYVGNVQTFFYHCPFTPTLNTWYHIAVVRSGTTCYIFINGVPQTVTVAKAWSGTTNFAATLEIGRTVSRSVYWAGMISELRISTTARYTAAFTPITSKFSSDAYTKLLLHFAATGTSFADSGPLNKTITPYGNATQVYTPIADTGIVFLDGTGDALVVGDTTSFYFLHKVGTTGKWSICFQYLWLNRTAISRILTTSLGGTTIGFSMYFNATRYVVCGIDSGVSGGQVVSLTSSSALPDDAAWHRIVLTYDQSLASNNAKLYLDGTLIGSATKTAYTPSTSDATYPLNIGARPETQANPFQGYLTELAIYDGTIISYANQTAKIGPTSYTKLLLHMSDLLQNFIDYSDPSEDNGFPIIPAGVTITPVGTIAGNKLKSGRTNLYFDGITNAITLSDNESWDLWSGNCTLCGWIKFSTLAVKVFFTQYVDASNYWQLAYIHSSLYIRLLITISGDAVAMFTCPWTPAINTWYHITVIRTGSSCSMFINGLYVTTTSGTAFGTIPDLAGVLRIGMANTACTSQNFKDLMIFKGVVLTIQQIRSIIEETYIE